MEKENKPKKKLIERPNLHKRPLERHYGAGCTDLNNNDGTLEEYGSMSEEELCSLPWDEQEKVRIILSRG